MKNLIVQIYVDTKKYENPNLLPSFDELSTTSFTLAKHYAEEIGADYLLLTDAYINHIHPTYERFRLFEESKWTDEYDQVLYLDSDVFIYQGSPNIFEMYPGTDEFKVCTHWSNYRYGVEEKSFNAGVFMMNKYSRNTMLPHLNYKLPVAPVGHDNAVLADCVEKSKVNLKFMDPKFNAKNSEIGFFCHAWGSGKRQSPLLPCIEKAVQEAKQL